MEESKPWTIDEAKEKSYNGFLDYHVDMNELKAIVETWADRSEPDEWFMIDMFRIAIARCMAAEEHCKMQETVALNHTRF